MIYFPKFRKLKLEQEYTSYAATYEKYAGLPVPISYLESNHVFGIYIKDQLVGGFILGSGNQLRTIEFFAAQEAYPSLHAQMEALDSYTEICCFWMDPAFRKKPLVNYFTWLSMAFALKKYSKDHLIFGTKSCRLAALYSATPKSVFLHSDFMNNKQTFIYIGKKDDCFVGIAQVILYKLKRTLPIIKNRQIPLVFSKAVN